MQKSDGLIQVKKLGKPQPSTSKAPKGKNKVLPKGIILKEERDLKIDQTLDTLVDNLIQRGELKPGRSYMIKTQEMKEHIGRMCDRIDRKKQGLPEFPEPEQEVTRPPKPKIAVVEVPKTSRKIVQEPSRPPPPVSMIAEIKEPPKTSGERPKSSSSIIEKEPSKLVRRDSSRTPKAKTTKSFTKSLFKPGEPLVLGFNDDFEPEMTPARASVEAYKAVVDLTGFLDENISLEIRGNRVIIIAQRPQNIELGLHARKVIEIVDIPIGVNLQHVRVGRGTDGSMVIEEFA